MELKEQILEEAMRQFNRDGFDFKMDDLAKELHISKKTIYKHFKNKEDIFHVFIDESFQSVHEQQEGIFYDDNLSIKEKLLRILNTRSRFEDRLSIEKTMELNTYYPRLYELIINTYRTQWDKVKKLIIQGQENGVFKKDINVTLVQTMMMESMQMMHRDNLLSKANLSYRDAIKEASEIIVSGISL
jgi:AcrR family transcriptional regulator